MQSRRDVPMCRGSEFKAPECDNEGKSWRWMGVRENNGADDLRDFLDKCMVGFDWLIREYFVYVLFCLRFVLFSFVYVLLGS